MTDKALIISPLTLGYHGKAIVRFAGMQLEKASQCLISGPSGCGKTTLLYAIAGLLQPMTGAITVNGTEISSMTESRRDRFRGTHIGMVFQTLHLVKSLSVMDNLMLPSAMAGLVPQRERAFSLLEQMQIADKKDSLPYQLSHGQAQRVAIARAVLHKPALLLADEPTSSLDDKACESVINILKEQAQQAGSTLLISTHDNRVRAHFNQIVLLAGVS